MTYDDAQTAAPSMEQPMPKSRAEQVRDLIMIILLVIWATFGILSVYQIFRDGSKVLESLPPFWFWGIPLAPFTALYAPWGSAVRSAVAVVQSPEPPKPSEPT